MKRKKTSKSLIYNQAIDILTSQGKFYINLELKRVQKILEILNNPQKKLKFIHVAGTNGKGSVCSILSSIINQSEIKVGLFTSPHVFEYSERIKINAVEISEDDFAKNVIEIVKISEKNNIHLTEFEILTVVAFVYFAKNNVDVVVLETGLGGRLDATNVIHENVCSIITHIDFDHTERLGDSIEKIAYEKAGIIKKNCPVIISPDNVGFEVIKTIANEKKSPIILTAEVPESLHDSLALKGKYQKENLALVLSATEFLKEKGFNITEEAIEIGLKNVKHPCRFEFLQDKNILIDGAHNLDGTRALRESLNYYFPNQKFRFIFGCLKNKNYSEMMKVLFTDKDEIYFYHFNNENSCTYEELTDAWEHKSLMFSDFKHDSETLTVICGSFYMIKELLGIIRKNGHKVGRV